MRSERALYNSRLISVYTSLLREKYPGVSLSEILAYAGIEPYEISDEGCWFTQRQVDRFYEKTVQLTGNEAIAREAGRQAASPGAIGALRQHMFGVLGPSLVFKAISRVTKNLTRAGDYQAEVFKDNKVEITVKPHPDVNEKPYQCENRIGFFEAVIAGFNLGLPAVEHPECIFRGDVCCRYIVSWKRTLSNSISSVRNLLGGLILLGLIPAFVSLPMVWFAHLFAPLTLLFLGLSLATELVLRKEMTRSMNNLYDSSDRLTQLIDSSSKNVQLVNDIGQALVNKKSVEDVLGAVTRIMEKGLDFDNGAILLANDAGTRLEMRAAFGYSQDNLSKISNASFNLDNPLSQGPFVLAFHQKKPYMIDSTNEILATLSERSQKLVELLDLNSFLCCPILVDNESLGIIAVSNKSTRRPLVRSDVILLQGIAPTIGVALQNAELIEDQLASFEKTLKVLADSIDARDYLTSGHSEVVTIYAAAIAEEMGLSEEFTQMVRIASLLHDYGKIGVPDSILKKNGALTEAEREIINTHPVRTQQILSQVPFRGLDQEIPEIAGAHHERWDGKGYPKALKGEQIPLGARIIAVADFFEAITAKRHYRQPMPLDVALKLLQESSGSHFDPQVVAAFLRYLEKNAYQRPKTDAPQFLFSSSGLRRKYPRVEYRTQVSIRHGDRILSGDTMNIGAKGLYIISNDSVRVGETLIITYALPASEELVQHTCEVAWLSDFEAHDAGSCPRGFAVNFVNVPVNVLAEINLFVRKQISSVANPATEKVS